MKTRKSILNYIAILGLVAGATPLYSTTVSYATRASWLGNVTGVTTTTFDTAVAGYTPPGPDGFVGLAFGGITLDGVKFQGYDHSGTEYALGIVTSGPNSTYYNWGTGGAILRGYADSYQGALAHLHITLSTAATAWGTDLMLGGGTPGNFTVKPNGADCTPACLAPTFALPTAAFFGMTSDTPFTFIDLFVPSNAYPALDNFSTAMASAGTPPPPPGDGSETPEAATMVLCATGLLGIANAKKVRSLITA